jgi:hypothetical protein
MNKIISLITYCIFLNGCATLSTGINNTCKSYFDNQMKQEVFTVVDMQPEFIEGYAAFYQQVRYYFQYPKDLPLQTKVILELIIDKKGKVISTKIHNKKEAEYTLVDKEGIRVMTKIVGFKPGKCNNKAVCSKLILPITLLLKE